MRNKLIILELKPCRKNVEFKVSVIAQGTEDESQIFAYTNRGWWKMENHCFSKILQIANR